MEDRTTETGLIAVQGPNAASLLDPLCRLADGAAPSSLRFFTWGSGSVQGREVFIGRTGYTGEDGF